MSLTWIKICGITRAEDAHTAQALGVNAIGLVFYPPSPRALTPAQADVVLRGVAPATTVTGDALNIVALFVNPSRNQVRDALLDGRVTHLQFHGEEPAGFCESFGLPYLKAFRVQSAQAVLDSLPAYSSAQYLLLDGYQKNVPGGTGKIFDWSMAAAIVRQSKVPVILAGGLQAENVSQAISQVKPFGVDVSSGVESKPGMKDLQKMQTFVQGVRSVGA